ncbi:MAG: D-aminoacyl-tRNA deacylase [Paracoccaceae bacterium]
MRAVIQRVSSASVSVEGSVSGQIDRGLLILICAMQGDSSEQVAIISNKIIKLRIFPDDVGRMNRSLLDVNGAALVVSQFTLAADTSRGNRPGFSDAAPPETARVLYEEFCTKLRALGPSVSTGQFGAHMAVSLVNDGPVTIWLDS